ncbi:hypothetical protein BRC2024_KCUCJSVR_CDS_0014 [Acinetobacter phage vB_AbaM_KissB]
MTNPSFCVSNDQKIIYKFLLVKETYFCLIISIILVVRFMYYALYDMSIYTCQE